MKKKSRKSGANKLASKRTNEKGRKEGRKEETIHAILLTSVKFEIERKKEKQPRKRKSNVLNESVNQRK